MTERKLASIRRIDAIESIPNADAIEVAVVGGWRVVVKKNDFSVGEPACYLEIDSWVPTALAPFLSKGKEPRVYNGVQGEKLRSIKLRGVISQGLLLPLSVASPHFTGTSDAPLNEGDDVTSFLGIQKWEAQLPAELAGQAQGLFPSWIRRTDQERCQNLKNEIFGYEVVENEIPGLTVEQALQDNARGISEGRIQIRGDRVFSVKQPKAHREDRYEVSVKLDGSSMTTFARQLFTEPHIDGDGVTQNPIESGVCSRNLQLKVNAENSSNTFVKTAVETRLLEVLEMLAADGLDYAVQGELMGTGIQGNQEKITGEHKFFVFDIFEILSGRYLAPAERKSVFEKMKMMGAKIEHVPVLHESVTLQELGITDIDSALAFAEGPSLNPAVQREGVVFKRVDGQFSFKAISNKWLIKNDS